MGANKKDCVADRDSNTRVNSLCYKLCNQHRANQLKESKNYGWLITVLKNRYYKGVTNMLTHAVTYCFMQSNHLLLLASPNKFHKFLLIRISRLYYCP